MLMYMSRCRNNVLLHARVMLPLNTRYLVDRLSQFKSMEWKHITHDAAGLAVLSILECCYHINFITVSAILHLFISFSSRSQHPGFFILNARDADDIQSTSYFPRHLKFRTCLLFLTFSWHRKIPHRFNI